MTPKIESFLHKTLSSQDLRIHPLAGDASSRRYYRVIKNDAPYVLMLWEPFEDNGRYPFLNVLDHFAKHKIRVPKVIAKNPELGVVLLEDLGDLTLERKFWENQNQNLALPFYRLAIDELIKIHYPATFDKNSNCVAFGIAFDTAKLLWEMNYGREHLLQKMCRITMSDSVDKSLTKIFTDICTRLDQEEKLICHRDYHSRNIMLKLGDARIIDFQDARMGTLQYDLVSLVHDSYVNLSDISRNEILQDYINKANEYRKNKILKPHFDSVMSLQTIQRCFKACGSFSSFYNMREDLRYLKYLGPTIRQVVGILDDYPEYKLFRDLIVDNGLLENDYLNPTEMK